MIQFQNSTPFYGLNLDRLDRLKQRICVRIQPFYDSQVRQVMGKVTVLNVQGACFSFDALHTQKKLCSR